MAGSNGGAGSGGDAAVSSARALSRIVSENPWAVIVVALISGGTGGSLFGAPDRFTGAQGAALESRVRAIEYTQQLDDQHRKDSADGYRLIYANKQAIANIDAELRQCRREIDRLQQDRP